MARRVTEEIASVPEPAAVVAELLAQGLSKSEVASRLGVSRTTVYRALGGAEGRRSRGAGEQRSGGAEDLIGNRAGFGSGEGSEKGKDDGYPEALLRRVPRDFVAVLPPGHYQALVAAARRAGTAAAAESLRQALLLHAEPLIPPPTSIELALSAEEQAELGEGEQGSGGGRGAAGQNVQR